MSKNHIAELREMERKLDEASSASFPASDPPAYMGSFAVAGAPPLRRTDSEGGRRRTRGRLSGDRNAPAPRTRAARA